MKPRDATINLTRATHRPWTRDRSATAHGGGLAYGLLYVPSLLAWLVADAAALSYGVAWAGSVWILWLSMTGRVKPLPGGRPLAEQLMRPIGFTQAICAGYMALTSLFFALDQMGVSMVEGQALRRPESLEWIAAAQRFYLLGHAALVTGILLLMNYTRAPRWRVRTNDSPSRTMLVVAGVAFALSAAVQAVPGFGQVGIRFGTVSLVASVLALACAVPERKRGTLDMAVLLFAFNLVQALLSGWKEEALVMILLLGVFLYPYYRSFVLVTMPLVLGVFVLVMPTYNKVFREQGWSGGADASTAAASARDAVVQADAYLLQENTWTFLTDRLSEISLFIVYLQVTPAERPYYGTRLVEQSVAMLVPRVLWPEKPNVESLVMERVYASGITNESSSVSAKPQFVVDGYLSYGGLGVWLACLMYGLLASTMSRLAERWFGGYLFGTALAYTALFQNLWRGNSFEFLIPNVFWSLIIMYGVFMLGRRTNRIVPA